jgi:hypothetical protein
MKRFSDLFRSKKREPKGPAPVSEALLADLEAEVAASALGFRWVPLNRAGDLCDRAGDRDRALAYYGRAIDVMLEDGQAEPARGLATKIVRIHPAAVRTLCTLTWLDLASHHMASVTVHLNEYVRSARFAGRQDLAGEQVYLMAHVVADVQFRSAVANALDALEHDDDAAEVREWVAKGRAPHDEDEELPEDWSERCLSHALGSHVRAVDEPAGAGVGEEGNDGGSDSGDPADWGTSEVDTEAPEGNTGEDVEEALAKGDLLSDGQDRTEEYRT